jgi:Ca2+-binding RTX toxin-like protein
MATPNILWGQANASIITSLSSWQNPDGSIAFFPNETLLFDDREGVFVGSILSNENIDFITVNLTSGNSYILLAEGDWPINIEIFDSQGYLLNSIDGDWVEFFDGPLEDSILVFNPLVSGIYYVSVNWDSPLMSGGYSIYALEDISANSRNDLSPPSMSVTVNGLSQSIPATAYVGPVAGLQWQFLGSSAGEAVAASDGADFLNLLGGDDAADGRGGNDVLDGGLGSNFLTGGSGLDVFFLDGRGGSVTWATITDWEVGEQLSLWGFRPGVSTLTWVEMAGAPGFQGVTLHADLDGNQTIDASVTWAGRSQGQLPTPLEFDGLLWFQ